MIHHLHDTRLPKATHVRWIIRSDLDDIAAIEEAHGVDPWQPAQIERQLRHRDKIGQLVELDERHIAGYMIYHLGKDELVLNRLAVHPEWQRRGVATCMIRKLCGKLDRGRRRRILVSVPERNLPLQLFLREVGFVASDIARGAAAGEDAYLMVLRKGWHDAAF